MKNLTRSLRSGSNAAWLGASLAAYSVTAYVAIQALDFVSTSMLGLPWISRAAVLVGIAGLPFVALYGMRRARAARGNRPDDDFERERLTSQVERLEEERDFYRALVDGNPEHEAARAERRSDES